MPHPLSAVLKGIEDRNRMTANMKKLEDVRKRADVSADKQ